MPPRTRKQLSARADRPIKDDPDAVGLQNARTKPSLLSLPGEVRQTVLKHVRILHVLDRRN
jgi:hypothetical protein